MAGYITIPRDIVSTWLWENPRRFWMWCKLCMMAAYEDGTTRIGNVKIEYTRQQIVCTISTLMNQLKISNRALHVFLEILVEEKMITLESGKKYTVITLLYTMDNVTQIGSRTAPVGESLHQKSQTIKTKEESNNNHFTSREGEQKFFEELRQSQIFWEETAMSLSCDIGLARKLGEKFFVEVLAKESYHGSLQELKQHLVNWLRIALRKDVAPNNQKTTNYKSSKNEDERYAVRRGTGVAAHTADDYRKPF